MLTPHELLKLNCIELQNVRPGRYYTNWDQDIGWLKGAGGADSILGGRIKRELVKLLCELGLPSAKVPLSGAIGDAWAGDVHLDLQGRTLKIEVKARREFRSMQQWLSGADLLLLKPDRQPPLAVLPLAYSRN